jgi:hypothetical protein
MNPMTTLLNVISPAHRERAALTRAACTRAFAACELLPQFISCADRSGKFGLLNVVNGCFVRVTDTLEPALHLSWTPAGENGHLFYLEEEAQIVRFVAAMQAQARLMRAERAERAEQSDRAADGHLLSTNHAEGHRAS